MPIGRYYDGLRSYSSFWRHQCDWVSQAFNVKVDGVRTQYCWCCCSAALQCAWDSAAGRHWRTLPTRLLQYNIDIPAPFLVHLYNSLFHTSSVPMLFKSAYITPLSKSDFDPADPKSYHPVGNLMVKAARASHCLTTCRLLEDGMAAIPKLQSAYQAWHSTETAGTHWHPYGTGYWQHLYVDVTWSIDNGR